MLRYQALIEEAVAEFGAGTFLEARALFRAAHNVYPNARTLRGIGVTSFELRAYDDAYRYLTAALGSTVRPLTDAQRAEVEGLLARTHRLVAIFDTRTLPEGTRVFVDGVATAPEADGVIVLTLGRHELEIRLDDRTGRATLTIAGGENGALPVELPTVTPRVEPIVSAPPPVPSRAPTYRRVARVLLPTGAAATGLGALFFALGARDASRVEGASPGTEWNGLERAYDRAPRRSITGLTMLGVGVGIAGVGLVYALRGREPEDAAGVATALRVGPSSLATEVRW